MSVFEDRLAWELPRSVWQHLLLMDVDAWDSIAEIEVIQSALQHAAKYGRDLIPEVFWGLYNNHTTLAPRAPQALESVHALLGRAARLPDWEALRQAVNGDELAAAFGTAAFAIEWIERLPAPLKKKLEAAAGIHAQRSALDAQQSALEALLGLPGMPQTPLDRQIAQGAKRLEQLDVQAGRAREQALAALMGAQAQIENAAVHSISQAHSDLAQLQAAADCLGLDWGVAAGGGPSRAQIHGLQALAACLKSSRPLREALEALGWARQLVSQEKRKSKGGRDKFTQYATRALEVETLAPQEFLGYLAPPNSLLGLDFIARAAEDDLLHMQFEGEEDGRAGPIVFVSDTSGSMRGRRSILRAAIELAMMIEARKAQRRFVAIPFSGAGQFKIFDPGPAPAAEELAAHVAFGYWGGTEPYAPLEAAIDIIQTDASLRRGDICILTDGRFGTPPPAFLDKLQAARQDPGLKIAALVIGPQAGQAGFADKLVLAEDLLADKDQWGPALSIFF